jgi:hypothetical protein
MKLKIQNLTRFLLGILLLIVAINAFGGGIYGMVGAKDIPVEWLEGGPFSSFFIPSMFLFVVIGGACLFTAIMVFRQRRIARKASFLCGLLILAWIIVQVSIIGYVSWLQPAIAISGVLILLLAKKLQDGVENIT